MAYTIVDIENILKEKLKVTELDKNATLDTYGLDSLDVMEFLFDMEEKLKVTFTGEEVKDLKTVGELLKVIENKLK